MNIAIIPARGGSKRIKNKNIRSFLGKPIISYPIKEILKSKIFDKVIVSTDNDKIANIAKIYGGEILFKRPTSFAKPIAQIKKDRLLILQKCEEKWCKM